MVVIVNADDLGLSRPVNTAIFALMDQGAVTSATVLANGAAIEDAAAELRRFPRCSFGVHLNLTEFKPLSAAEGLQSILDNEGNFRGNHIREIRLGNELKRAIFHEWCAQIDRLIALGIRPSHLDSHHHTHTIPALLPLLRRIRQKYRIEKVRLSRNVYRAGEPLAFRMKKAAYNLALRRVAGFRTTQLFSGLDMFLEIHDGSGRHTASTVHAHSIELMVHPGAPASEQERKLLVDWLRQPPPSVRLISYNDL